MMTAYFFKVDKQEDPAYGSAVDSALAMKMQNLDVAYARSQCILLPPLCENAENEDDNG